MHITLYKFVMYDSITGTSTILRDQENKYIQCIKEKLYSIIPISIENGITADILYIF